MPPTRTNRVLQITTRVVDKLTPVLKAQRIALRLLRSVATGTFRAIAGAVRLAGRALRTLLGPISLITTALSGFGALKILRIATEVGDQVREIGTLIPGITETALDRLSDQIRMAAVEGGQRFEDEFKAAYDAISAGVDAQKLIGFLGTANRLAVAGATDVGTAVDLLTGTLNAFGKDASEADRFADALFTTVRKGKTTVEELAGSIGQVSSIARLAGLSIEDTGAAMAALTLTLGNSELAATQFKAALTALTKTTAQQRAEAARLANGLDLSLGNLQRKGLLGFLEEFNTKTEGSLDVIARIIPNIRAVSGLAILAADNGEKFADAADAMRRNVGAAADAFELRAESAGHAFRQLRAAIADIAVEIGNEFLPQLAESADRLRTFLSDNRERFSEWAAGVRRSITFVARAIPEVGRLVRDFLTDPTEVSNLGSVMEDLAAFALATARETAIGVVKIILAVIRGSFRQFTDIAGIVAEQVGARILRSLVAPFVKLPSLIGKALVAGLDEVPAGVRVALGRFIPALGDVESAVRGAAFAADVGLDALASRIAGVSEDKIKDAEQILGELAQSVVANIAKTASDGGEAFQGAIDGIAEAFDELRSDFAALGGSSPAVTAFLDAIDRIRSQLDQAEQAAARFSDTILGQFLNAAEQARRNAESLGAGGGGFKFEDTLLGQFIGAAHEGDISERVYRLFEKARAAAASVSGTVGEGAADGLNYVVSQIRTPYELAFDLIVDLARTAEQSFDRAIDDAVEGTFKLRTAVEDLGKAALKIFAKIAAKQLAFAVTSALFPDFSKQIAGARGSGIRFEKGGITPGPLQRIAFGAFAGGGITNSPMLALIGEGAQREAVVPLPDGRSIPAIIREPASGPNIVINMPINAIDARSFDQELDQRAQRIQNIVAAGINSRRQFRQTVRGGR